MKGEVAAPVPAGMLAVFAIPGASANGMISSRSDLSSNQVWKNDRLFIGRKKRKSAARSRMSKRFFFFFFKLDTYCCCCSTAHRHTAEHGHTYLYVLGCCRVDLEAMFILVSSSLHVLHTKYYKTYAKLRNCPSGGIVFRTNAVPKNQIFSVCSHTIVGSDYYESPRQYAPTNCVPHNAGRFCLL